jgi:RHS repeat-associated protein
MPNGMNIEYVIDGLNRRIGKKINGVLVRGWLYADQLRPVAELDGSGAIVSTFVYGTRATTPDYIIRNRVTYRVVADYLGGPRYVIDSSSMTLAQKITYDEFGAVLNDSNSGFQPFGFAGGLYDADTRLLHLGARDYDPENGRWISKDPIGFDGSDANVYEYAFSDPINITDPTGLDVWLEGPSHSEPTGHLSINVGDPNGDYASFSFGMNGHGLQGEVYRDTSLMGNILDEYYLKTTAEEDLRVFNMLIALQGDKAGYRPWRTCRNFSIENFDRIRRMHIGRPAAPKYRSPSGVAGSSSVPSSLKPSATDARNSSSTQPPGRK